MNAIHQRREYRLEAQKQAALISELKIYASTGIPLKYIRSKDQLVKDDEYIHYTEISLTPRASNNTIVLIHGYGGSNNIYFKMVSYLADHFHIIAVDLPGMGLSYRPSSPFNNSETCLEYFMDRLWRFFNAINLDKFFLLGHSLGAFIATHYFNRNAEKIIKLFILSPAGFNEYCPEVSNRIEQVLNTQPYFKRKLFRFLKWRVWEHKKSTFEAIWFPWKEFAVWVYLKQPKYKFTEREIELLVTYTAYVLSLQQCGERSIAYLLERGIRSKIPLIDIIDAHRERDLDIFILYGERDWMDKNESIKELQDRKLRCTVHEIAKSEHQIITQNPLDVCKIIIDVYRRFKSKSKDDCATPGVLPTLIT